MLGLQAEILTFLHVDCLRERIRVAQSVRGLLDQYAGSVHCWAWLNRPTSGEFDHWFHLLSDDEKERAFAFHFEHDRYRFAGC